jgi:Predicted RNA-binding protein containing KH domain, possibly ribosomal protein
MPKLDITSQERSALRAAAHPLRPVVLIGERGLTESVLKEIDLNLKAHQLIKVRVAGDDREARSTMLETICETLSCATVHHLGKTLIIYRPDPEARSSVLAGQQAPKEPPTRAVRKPSEPYTPKKAAASGVMKTRRSEKTRKQLARVDRAHEEKDVGFEAPRSTRSPAARGVSNLRIPRRTGSAMSLKSGVRRRRGA